MFELCLAVAIVIVTSAVCSLFEATLYAVPVSHVERLVQKGRPAGRILKDLRRQVDKPITAILALNTIANTAGAAVAGALAVRALGEGWLGWFSAAFTAAILLFSEVIPKTAGVVFSKSLSVVIAWPLKIMVQLFAPVIWLCGTVTSVITGKATENKVSSEELAIMVRLGRKAGTIGDDEATVIENILSLREKTVKDILTPRTVIVALEAKDTVAAVAKDKRIYNHSRLPVFYQKLDEIAGIALRSDILAAMAKGEDEKPVDSLTRPAHFVLETTPLDRTLTSFLERREHMFVVIDEFGAVAGVVTLEDVLEEILGKEIVDESDEADDLRNLARRRRDRLLESNRPGPAAGAPGKDEVKAP